MGNSIEAKTLDCLEMDQNIRSSCASKLEYSGKLGVPLSSACKTGAKTDWIQSKMRKELTFTSCGCVYTNRRIKERSSTLPHPHSIALLIFLCCRSSTSGTIRAGRGKDP